MKKAPNFRLILVLFLVVLSLLWNWKNSTTLSEGGAREQLAANGKSKDELASKTSLRVPSAQAREQVGLTAIRSNISSPNDGGRVEDRVAQLSSRRGLASIAASKNLVLRDLGLKGRGLSRFKLLVGYRAFSGGREKIPEGFRFSQQVGPYQIVEASTPELRKIWEGSVANKITETSLPVLVHERDKRVYVVTGVLKIRLAEFSDANVSALLDDHQLKKIGVVEGIAFLEASVSEGIDIFAAFQKLQADSRVIMVDLDFYQAPPRLK